MLLEKELSCFLLVDVQEKLTPAVLEHETLIKRCEWLMRLAHTLEVPSITSEQYPKGLGATVKPLLALTENSHRIEKVHFSCKGETTFTHHLSQLNKPQIVIAGIETHVCVLQSAIDLKQSGQDVFVVADAVSARHSDDHHYGLSRMRQAGVSLVTAEMVFFEWVRKAGTSEFKQLSQIFLQ